MTAESKLDYRLVHAIRGGAEALPNDITCLRGYLRMIEALLAEKAAELEPSWEQACAVAAEIETLQSLEVAVAERAIASAPTASRPSAANSRSGARSRPAPKTKT